MIKILKNLWCDMFHFKEHEYVLHTSSGGSDDPLDINGWVTWKCYKCGREWE
jgi:hypothetical protein